MYNIANILQIQFTNFHPSELKCGTKIDENCRKDYNNRKDNPEKLKEFYHRCRTEEGANPIRNTCALCCKQSNSLNRIDT